MNRLFSFLFLGAITCLPWAFHLRAEAAANHAVIMDLNTPRTFPEIKTRAQWEKRAQEIREQVLVSCGLWPLPDKTPLQGRVFGRIERDGYSVEKVYFQTYPGFYLAGNLYRPLGKGKGPFPGVLNPHGHWPEGRLSETTVASVAARCINLARQGMVAFCYDMAGYNDTRFPDGPTNCSFYDAHVQFGTNRTDLLWNVSLMGLQTWNTIRALDFLESLPDVDAKRLACTGASGGGTQTFMLGAIDNRLVAQAPMVMVSHTMQGGCPCENAPGLRVKYSNMEIAAAAAPRPQLLVAVTGDWTKATLEVEGPAIRKIYELFGAADHLRYLRFDAKHNYNQTTREALYAWFDRWLLGQPDALSLAEQPYQKEPDANLRVFPDNQLPDDALPRDRFIESLKQAHRKQWQAVVPRTKASFEKFKQAMLPAWKHTLQLEWPPATDGDGKLPRESSKMVKPVVVLAVAEGKERLTQELGSNLRGRASKVLPLPVPASRISSNPFTNLFTVYNRTELQRGVGFLVQQCGNLSKEGNPSPVVLFAAGRAGLWALLAAPAADAVVADCDQLDVTSDEALLVPDLLCSGLRNIGTFEGAAMLAAPHPLLLHNTGDKFPTEALRTTYRALGASKKLRLESRKLSDDEIVEWIANLKL